MEVTKTALPGSKLELRLQMSAADVESAYAKVYKELADQGGIPGFRRGKAPAKVIRRRVGEEPVREMAWMRLLEDHYPTMLEAEDIQPLTDPVFPDLEDLPLAEGQPLEFTISLVVRPVPAIKQYKGFRLLRPSTDVTDEQLSEALERLRETAAELSEPDRDVVAEGDAVTASFSVVPEGEEPDGEPTEQEFIIGSGDYEPAIDMAMVGKKVGDVVTMEHEYAEDYRSRLVAGKKVTVTATIESIMQRTLPELNDEFAAQQGDFETLDALKDTLREQLARQLQADAEREVEQNALGAVMANTTIDLPEAVVERLAETGFGEFSVSLERDGLDLETFTEIAQISEEDIRENQRLRAEALMKFHFTLSHIQREEKIEATDDDLEAEIVRFADGSDTEADFVRQAMEVQEELREQFRERAMRNKVIALIVDSSEIVDIPHADYEQAKQAEQARLVELAEQLRAEAAAAAPAAEEPAEAAAEAAGEQAQDAVETGTVAAEAAGEQTQDAVETDTDTGEQAADTSETQTGAEPSDTQAESE